MASSDDQFARTVLVVLVVLVGLPFLLMLVMMPMMGVAGWSHMGTGGMGLGGGAWFVVLSMLLVPLLVFAAVGYAVYRLAGTRGGRPSDEALEELRMAYARGDLSDEEFENRRQRLEEE